MKSTIQKLIKKWFTRKIYTVDMCFGSSSSSRWYSFSFPTHSDAKKWMQKQERSEYLAALPLNMAIMGVTDMRTLECSEVLDMYQPEDDKTQQE